MNLRRRFRGVVRSAAGLGVCPAAEAEERLEKEPCPEEEVKSCSDVFAVGPGKVGEEPEPLRSSYIKCSLRRRTLGKSRARGARGRS